MQMIAIIYKPTKSSMQSGKANTKKWLLSFEHDGSREIEPIMGWTASQDMMQEVHLEFSSLEQAISYAQKNKIDYQVIEPLSNKMVLQSYASNFK
jgi:hypothetical protein